MASDFTSDTSDVLRCPVCGGSVRVLDADAFLSHTLEVLLQSGITVDALRRYDEEVRNLLWDLDNNEVSAEEVPERLRGEAPELATLADVLPRTRVELYAFLGLIIAAISYDHQLRDATCHYLGR